MITTAITEMFGVKYPIICGAMMWLCKPPLCAAISNGGGLGNITAANYETEQDFRNAIHEARELTNKPFMVNVTILPSVRITGDMHKMYLRVCAEEKVAGMEISGMPIDKACGMAYIDLLKKAGVKLFHKVGSVRHAKHAEKVGYDGVYAAGIEEGGHPLDDDVTTMVLTPRIIESTRFTVVTVGGIGNGVTMAGALTLGADGVMMGSRFIATKECPVHDNVKQELLNRKEMDTALICKSLKLQGRALKNECVDQILAMEADGGKFEDLLPFISGKRILEAWDQGNVEHAPMMVGQSIGFINDIPTCKELLDRMAKECESQIEKVYAKIHT
ncbi:MAG: nitronate monooxygenase [Proteobacteria bacterium]|nr:nitronate monooxygenase [Pseudomonadota bacterium]